jgi:hypothetical protein
MKTKVSILFYAKRAKANNLDVYLIYAQITIQSKRFEFSQTSI